MTNTYLQYRIEVPDEQESEILTALLSSAGFEGFETQENLLLASGAAAAVDVKLTSEILSERGLAFVTEEIPAQNWNELWESNFQPVRVEDFAGIRAHFHPPFAGVRHEVIITPKMSFGTGHHATTWQMIRMMQDLPVAGARVLDMGTGTGVLAILAELMGAAHVLAIDNDEWSVANARENVAVNGCTRTEIMQADSLAGQRHFDIILANINRHILLELMPGFANVLAEGGHLVLSGLLLHDEPEMDGIVLLQPGFSKLRRSQRDGWIALVYRKKGQAC